MTKTHTTPPAISSADENLVLSPSNTINSLAPRSTTFPAAISKALNSSSSGPCAFIFCS